MKWKEWNRNPDFFNICHISCKYTWTSVRYLDRASRDWWSPVQRHIFEKISKLADAPPKSNGKNMWKKQKRTGMHGTDCINWRIAEPEFPDAAAEPEQESDLWSGHVFERSGSQHGPHQDYSWKENFSWIIKINVFARRQCVNSSWFWYTGAPQQWRPIRVKS